MKTTTKKFDTVSFFRAEKERIAEEISNMSFEELKDYLKSKSAWMKENKNRPDNG
jgi:hypothetical protein